MSDGIGAALDAAVAAAMKPAESLSFTEIRNLFQLLQAAVGEPYAHAVMAWLDMLRDQGIRLREMVPSGATNANQDEIQRHLRQTLQNMLDQLRLATAAKGAATLRPVVISVHGIRTRGKWQKDLAPVLAEAGFIPQLMDYGNFFAIQLLIPYFRRKRIEWFFHEYSRIAEKHSGRPISIVAHSFGTYLVARSLDKYRDHIRYDRIIFCGSIVNRDFPWGDLSAGRRVNYVLNEFGHMDVWAWVCAFVVSDAGQAGRYGFTSTDSCLTQREHREHRHSDYFHPLNYNQTWVPFLKGVAASALKAPPKQPINRRFQATIWFVILLVVVALFLWWRR
jgi:pimeloyl-ACP methyl ester carboxylesterase